MKRGLLIVGLALALSGCPTSSSKEGDTKDAAPPSAMPEITLKLSPVSDRPSDGYLVYPRGMQRAKATGNEVVLVTHVVGVQAVHLPSELGGVVVLKVTADQDCDTARRGCVPAAPRMGREPALPFPLLEDLPRSGTRTVELDGGQEGADFLVVRNRLPNGVKKTVQPPAVFFRVSTPDTPTTILSRYPQVAVSKVAAAAKCLPPVPMPDGGAPADAGARLPAECDGPHVPISKGSIPTERPQADNIRILLAEALRDGAPLETSGMDVSDQGLE